MSDQPMKKVLICDDNPLIIESISYAVRKAGLTCLTAQDGEQAIMTAQNELPQLMFLDISMPKYNGYEVCQQLKTNNSTEDIYIEILTAHGQAEDAKKTAHAGANEYMTKPFSMKIIKQKLAMLVEPN